MRRCPQGGVLSHLLLSLVVDDLLELLTSNGIRCQGYADDIVILTRLSSQTLSATLYNGDWGWQRDGVVGLV